MGLFIKRGNFFVSGYSTDNLMTIRNQVQKEINPKKINFRYTLRVPSPLEKSWDEVRIGMPFIENSLF
jgi:hypothetical protein